MDEDAEFTSLEAVCVKLISKTPFWFFKLLIAFLYL